MKHFERHLSLSWSCCSRTTVSAVLGEFLVTGRALGECWELWDGWESAGRAVEALGECWKSAGRAMGGCWKCWKSTEEALEER